MRHCHITIMVLLVCSLSCVDATVAAGISGQTPASLTFLTGQPDQEKEIAWQHFAMRHGGQWTVLLDGDGYLRQAFVNHGPFLPLEQHALDFRVFFGDVLWFSAVSPETSTVLRFTESTMTPGGAYETWQATREDLDILWSTLTIVRAADNRVTGIINKLGQGCSAKEIPSFNKETAVANLLPTLEGTLIAAHDVVLYASGTDCLPVLTCYIAMKLEGYSRPVEHFCLVNQRGEIVFRRTLTVPYHRE